MLGGELNEDEHRAFERERLRLEQEHGDLDAAIAALLRVGTPDQLQVQRLKKRKLALKDRLGVLLDRMTPDIIA